jgi:hypothetical protein
MTGKRGDALGADLGALWYAGKHDLPDMAADYQTAWVNTPSGVSGSTSRGGGLGYDPGAQIDEMCDRVNKLLLDTKAVLVDVGEALVWVADQYAATDSSCKASYQSMQNYLEETNGD